MKNSIIILLFLSFLGNAFTQTTLNEDFENWPPQNWNLYELGLGGEWVHSTLYGGGLGYNGSECAVHKINNDYCDNWLVSPMIEITNGNYELNFREYSDDLDYYNWAGVYISTGSSNPNDGDFSILVESIQVEEIWSLQTIDLSAYNGENIYIAFVFNGTWSQYRIDNVSVAPASIVDGALTEIINPVGLNQNGSFENFVVTVRNYGSQSISSGSIDWNINSDNGTYNFSNLNIAPGSQQDIIITNYDFTNNGEYLLDATLNLTDDFDNSNNHIQGNYFVGNPKDIELTAIYPQGYAPNESTIMAQVKVTNKGNNVVQDFSVQWSFNSLEQTEVEFTGLNLNANENIILDLADIDLIYGLNTFSAEVLLAADTIFNNNSLNSTISVGSLWESFEGEMFPPEQWQADDYPYRDYFFPAHGDFYYYAQTDDNYFGEISDTIYTPILNIENGDEITFKLFNSSYFPTNDFLIWKNGETGEIQLLNEIDSQMESWDLLTYDLSNASGNNYIGFVFNSGGSYGNTMLDMITSTASVHQFENDLGIISFDFDNLAIQNTDHSFELTLRNYGLNDISANDYSIIIKDEDGNELLTESGIDLNSWELQTITINHSFSDISNTKIHILIDFQDDEYLKNNQSIDYHFSVISENSILSNIGSAEQENLMIPFDAGGDTWTLGDEDISQQLYYQSELDNSGFIHGIRLFYNESMAIGQTFPVQIKIAETDLDELSGGWFPQEDLAIVFDGSFDVYPGIRSIYIPFDEPYLYSGQNNVVIQFYQYEPGWPSTLARFYSSEGDGQVRGIRLNNVYELDINDLPDYWGEHTDHTYISFVFEEAANSGIISGTVTNNNDDPINEAKISVDNTNISVLTDANGYYELPELPYQEYTLTAEAFGYENLSQEINLENTQQTLDFQMISLPIVSISGSVYGSDNPSSPLIDIAIEISGYASNTVQTDENGTFIFSDIFGYHDYAIRIDVPGYEVYRQEFSVENDNIDLGDIILQNAFYSAFNVSAVYGNDQTFINWQAPLPRIDEKIQNDQNTPSYSLTNEAYEDVWLGNYFMNNELITLTSIEIQFDIYENAHDLVTVDIINEAGEVMISSVAFQTWNDTLMTIDIPNFSTSESYYAMLHWKDNEESTDALTLDYAENTPNTAYIMYPGEEPVLLSSVLGNPDASFILRVNTIKEDAGKYSDMDVSYNLYRGPVSEINIAEYLWDPINDAPLSDLYYMDNEMPTNQGEKITYGVEAIFSDGDAEYCFSNFLDIITGIEEATNKNNSLRIYPNPAKNQIYLEGMVGQEIEIYNQIGQHIESLKLNSSFESKDISIYKPGVYIVRIKETMLSYKFIKE